MMTIIEILLLLGITYLVFICVCLFFLDYFPVSYITYLIRKYIVRDLD